MNTSAASDEAPAEPEHCAARAVDLLAALHDRVVQPLAAASLVLGLADLADEDRIRAGAAVSAALVELRDVLLSATDQVESRALPEPAPLRSEERLATVVRSVVAETLANVRKHADPSEVTIVVQGADDGVTIDLLNDGVRAAGNGHRGVGLRLAAVKASSAGATLEAGPDNSGEWRVHVCVGR